MITANAIAAIELSFEKSLHENCVKAIGDTCTMSRRAISMVGDEAHHRICIINITSYAFRIVALFDFDTRDGARDFFGASAAVKSEKIDEHPAHDAFAEFVNMVCGAVNRRLSTSFRHAGMSTPFMLDGPCAKYINILNPAHLQMFEVVVNNTLHFGLTLCICTAKNAQIDFGPAQVEESEESSGELELF